MPVITKYVCDKCGATQDTDNQMWSVGVTVRANLSPTWTYPDRRANQLWCRSCTEKLGLLPTSDPVLANSIKENPPTLEDMIREIVNDEMANH